MRKEGSF
jgi:hypothetical protein